MTNILEIQMGNNDAKAATIGDYLRGLLSTLWTKDEGFSGKRPFGSSGWKYVVYAALIKAGAVPGEVDSDGNIVKVDNEAADALILQAIAGLK